MSVQRHVWALIIVSFSDKECLTSFESLWQGWGLSSIENCVNVKMINHVFNKWMIILKGLYNSYISTYMYCIFTTCQSQWLKYTLHRCRYILWTTRVLKYIVIILIHFHYLFKNIIFQYNYLQTALLFGKFFMTKIMLSHF